MRRIFAVAFCALAVIGCKWNNEFSKAEPTTGRLPSPADGANYVAVNTFAARLSAELAKGDSNKVASPIGVAHVLAMLTSGASSKTRDELLAQFGLDENTLPEFDESQRAFLNHVNAEPGKPLRIATALFTVWPVVLDSGYKSKMGATFDAEVKKLGSAGVGATGVVNRWVRQATDGEIPSLIDGLTKQEQLIVVCAVSFKADWEHPFDPARSGHFTTPQGEVWAQMMSQSGTYDYFQDETMQAVRLPYKGGTFAMTVMLPMPGHVVGSLLGRLPDASVGFSKHEGSVRVPKFRYDNEFDLSPAIEALGCTSLFDETCNLRNISVEMEKGFRISQMIHRAKINVDELGTRASSATAAVAAGSEGPEGAFAFNADRPFAFAITDTTTGVVVFWGIVRNPTQ